MQQGTRIATLKRAPKRCRLRMTTAGSTCDVRSLVRLSSPRTSALPLLHHSDMSLQYICTQVRRTAGSTCAVAPRVSAVMTGSSSAAGSWVSSTPLSPLCERL